MKIKTIYTWDSSEKFDELINDFEASHKVKATQTHIKVSRTESFLTILFVAVLYYEDKD